MAHVISFTTSRFDVAAERPNPINPIAGESVLNWLRVELGKLGYQTTVPDTEDWGWYIDARTDDASYLIGASADPSDADPMREWTIQIVRHRSLADKVFGRSKLLPDDPLTAHVERLVRQHCDAASITVERDAP